MQALDGARLLGAFDSLPILADQSFRRVVEDGRLRYRGRHGSPDLLDRLSARLLCSAIRASRHVAVLVSLPDAQPRRSPLLFAAALVTDAVTHLRADTVGHRVLYVCRDAHVRSQLKDVEAASVRLDTVFDLQYGRGGGGSLRTVSSGGLRFPSVLCIQAPADPLALIREHRPRWIAIDCGEGGELPWLPRVLDAARVTGTPVIGWTAAIFSGPVAQWRQAGGGVLRWPRRRDAAATHVDRVEDLQRDGITAAVTSVMLAGDGVEDLSRSLAAAAEALLAARSSQAGRLSLDAVSVGWMYLRALESLPVPLDVYEREAGSHWGVRRIAELHDDLKPLPEALRSSRTHAAMVRVLDALSAARERLERADSPLWLALANLCIDAASPCELIFPARSRLALFRQCLLAEFNVDAKDLHDVGVRLASLSQHTAEGDLDDASRSQPSDPGFRSLLVGLPNRYTDRRLGPFFQADNPEVVLWPHQEAVFQSRLRMLSSELQFDAHGLGQFLPGLEQVTGRERRAAPSLSLTGSRRVTPTLGTDTHGGQSASKGFWNRPDMADAIASLFESEIPGEDEDDRGAGAVLNDVGTADADQQGEDAWVQEAAEIRLQSGGILLLPVDEKVNVITRGQKGLVVKPQFVRSLRRGDEVLFIQGQRRQSLYELLLSRVHRNPVIARYAALVARWQEDFATAFAVAERAGAIDVERLLREMQERGSKIRTTAAIRGWLSRKVLAPSDAMDMKRIADVLSIGFVQQYYRQIHEARNRIWGLHINLSARLNRWLGSSEAGAAAVAQGDDVIDAELGLSVEDFRHSLLRLRVDTVSVRSGPFYRPTLGRLEGGPT